MRFVVITSRIFFAQFISAINIKRRQGCKKTRSLPIYFAHNRFSIPLLINCATSQRKSLRTKINKSCMEQITCPCIYTCARIYNSNIHYYNGRSVKVMLKWGKSLHNPKIIRTFAPTKENKSNKQ